MVLGASQRAAFERLETFYRGTIAGSFPVDSHPTVLTPPPAHPRSDDRQWPELGCLRGRLNGATLSYAQQRAAEVGTGADRVLICSGAIAEEEYFRALADDLGVEFEGLDTLPRELCPLTDARLIEANAAGILPLSIAGNTVLVVAPRGVAARRLVEMAGQNPDFSKRFRLTTSERLNRFVFRYANNAIGWRATTMLHDNQPVMSSAPPLWGRSAWPTVIMGAIAFAAMIAQPRITMIVFETLLATVFLAWVTLRLVGTLIERPRAVTRASIRDDELPVYSILIALYREASSVDGLLAAISALDYPAEKLDVKIVVEEDDHETREALVRAGLKAPFEIVVVPDIGPRTKPKALNAALPFARGSFLVIFDAEDRPEPEQLRRALDVFLADDSTLACVQACLTIDNTGDNWLAALFTAEYAGQFDVFLPALSALQLPLPLGGSSNHFRTATLRKVGAWDPFNVTEDADLGLRIARYGYRSRVIEQATYEEAPAQLGPWLRQRTRWFKGWMQTWLVHMRTPVRLAREIGLPGFVTFQLMVGGNVLAALIHPIFVVWFVATALRGHDLFDSHVMAALFGITVLAGYVTSAVLGALGLVRRKLIGALWVLPLIPLHWILLSIAAWRALYQLIRDPYRWEKTDHGLARTSRLARRKRARAIIARILGDSHGIGLQLARNNAAVQRRPPRAAV